MVAGTAALMLSANPSLTPSQVMTILEQTALDLGTPGYDQTYGYGRVRADLAVAAAVGASYHHHRLHHVYDLRPRAAFHPHPLRTDRP